MSNDPQSQSQSLQPGAATAIALTIAGSDSSGGAGIQADLKTFSAFGVYGASVITALTAQNTRGVSGVDPVAVDFIAAQFDAVMGDLAVTAIKTGMLGDRATVQHVARLVADHGAIPLVVDPVMVASSGDVLLAPDAIDAVRRDLIPRASLITPNLPEAAALLGASPARDGDEMTDQAHQLLALGCQAVLIKGGHGVGDAITDVLVSADGVVRLTTPRIATRNTHGTGCTLSAAITAGLATGKTLENSVRAAHAYVAHAIGAGAALKIGHGHGPVDHHFAIRNITEGT